MVSLQTGLRIDDVLHIRTKDLQKERFTLHEMKTGKPRRIRITNDLKSALLAQAGRFFVFENRLDPKRPRTRQAVFKDIKRAAVAFRVRDLNISPHSARKAYAVRQFKKCGDIKRVQQLLNHSSEAVTQLYALADILTARAHPRRVSQSREVKGEAGAP